MLLKIMKENIKIIIISIVILVLICCSAVFIINNLKTEEVNKPPILKPEPPVVTDGEILYFNEEARKRINDNLEIEFNNLDEIGEYFSNLPSDVTVSFIVRFSYILYVDNEEYKGWQEFGMSSDKYIDEDSPYQVEIINFSFSGEWLIFRVIKW